MIKVVLPLEDQRTLLLFSFSYLAESRYDASVNIQQGFEKLLIESITWKSQLAQSIPSI